MSRPTAYDANAYAWNLRRVPETVEINGRLEPHPARHSAVFVVHGMGDQASSETGAGLRSGFEDALEAIREWQRKTLGPSQVTADRVPPPFVYEGYWADYANLETSFPEDWSRFNGRERKFFQTLWETRAFSSISTYLWVLKQIARLVNPFRIGTIGLAAWLLYVALLLLTPLLLTAILFYAPRILTRILSDVRLYARPKGVAERAIVQRIDARVGTEFLRLIGMDWDFRTLPAAECVQASGVPVVFDRVVWIAHSLGSVVSYNVLSDLFRRATEVAVQGDEQQKRNVQHFRNTLRRFVTIGSPLDKFAYLFPDVLRPWEPLERDKLLNGGETSAATNATKKREIDDREWWVNFYHGLDPVSGSLENRRICGSNPPINLHTEWRATAVIPGLSHISYWTATEVLRFVLGRVYGVAYLRDKPVERQSSTKQTRWALAGFAVWTVVLWGTLILLVGFRVEIAGMIWKAVTTAFNTAIGR